MEIFVVIALIVVAAFAWSSRARHSKPPLDKSMIENFLDQAAESHKSHVEFMDKLESFTQSLDAIPETPATISQIDLTSEIDRLFDDSSLAHDTPPKAVILMGGVAAGKTTLRKKNYSQGFVLIDAAEMFHHLSRDNKMLPFPDSLLEPLELIGPLVAQRAIVEKRNIVTEIIGAEYVPANALISALKEAGYNVDVIAVTCDLEESIQRNLNRGDNISAYYAEQFQKKWLVDACGRFAP